MTQHQTATIGVLLDTQFSHGMRILQGVQDYAATQSGWQVLALHVTQEPVLGDLLRQRRLAGVIGPILSDRWLEGLPGSPVPMVNVSGASDVRRVPSVIPDDRAVGRLAARHFLDNGWRALACLAEAGSLAATLRRQGYAEEAGVAGVAIATPPPVDSYAPDAAWPDWLIALPRPCAVFCTSDYMARRLSAHVRALARRIPEDMAILGVGDSALDGILAGVELSSVILPGRRMGWRAAERLAESLGGLAPKAPLTERVAPEGLAVRASSALTLGRGALVARALALLQQHLSTPLDMDTLARQCGASRRTLELHFLRELGHGPATEQRRRMELARRLLTDTEMPLETVADATGFASLPHFSSAIRAATGMPPGAYRRAHGQAGSGNAERGRA